MVVYNFKGIQPIPNAMGLIDVILTRTQRGTPTVVHPGYKISRIRSFYMRKVKFTQQTTDEKLRLIVDAFPRTDEIHPFYADLMNVLYDRDHYKLALGQINTCRHLVQNIQKDYVRMLKYGDTLYRCKQLKRAALGRMCTLLKKQNACLGYLEEVRKHLARLPSIDPNTRTLLLTGYPNVGKSSFMNKVTRADVEVEPYAFTTKSLFVGHLDYKYQRWQVIDTPGILDRPLEERNTIEMQAVTALAHLQCSVLYFLDVSEQCGYSIQQQVELFHSIKPLFAGKPVFLVCNKIDVVPFEEVPEESRNLLTRLAADNNCELLPMSALSEEGVMSVKNAACEKLLQQRVSRKMSSSKMGSVLNRLTVAKPKPRKNGLGEVQMAEERAVCIPKGVLERRAAKKAGKDVVKPKVRRLVDPFDAYEGVFDYKGKDLAEQYLLKEETWKTDFIPEIMDGKNVSEYFAPDIAKRLQALEAEEALLAAEATKAARIAEANAGSDLDDEELELIDRIRDKKAKMIAKSRREKGKNRSALPAKYRDRSVDAFRKHLRDLGIDADIKGGRGDSGVGGRRKRARSVSRAKERAGMNVEASLQHNLNGDFLTDKKRKKGHKQSRSTSKVPPKGTAGMPKSISLRKHAEKVRRMKQTYNARKAKKGPGDRVIVNMMPKHLYSGKRGGGKTDRR